MRAVAIFRWVSCSERPIRWAREALDCIDIVTTAIFFFSTDCLNSEIFYCSSKIVSAVVTHPAHAKQSFSVTFAVVPSFSIKFFSCHSYYRVKNSIFT